MYVLERVQHRVPEEALRVSADAPPEAPHPCTLHPSSLPRLLAPSAWLWYHESARPGLACPAGRPSLAGGEDHPLPPGLMQLQVAGGEEAPGWGREDQGHLGC